MITSLTLSNFALFKKQTIEFSGGFNCLLGQSGAGKSIIIDALSFLLGAKSDKTFIRTGEKTMRVEGVFEGISSECKDLLTDWEIDCDDEIVISRTLSDDGKSSLKVNGFSVTAKMLQMLTLKMADFCGQHDSVGLLNVANHLSLLDKFAGKEVEQQKSKVASLFEMLKKVRAEISSLGGSDAERARQKDLLKFQIDEIENAHLELSEEETLKERFDFISSSEKIFESVGEALEKLTNQRENVTSNLYEAKNILSGLSKFHDIDECRERLENAYYEIKDVADVLETIKQNTDFDPRELERIDARLDLIKGLSKKYGRTIEDILAFQEDCQKRLDDLEKSEETLSKLQVEEDKVSKELALECENLTNLRKKYAVDFSEKIMQQLADLEMKGTKFVVEFSAAECSAKGADGVKFMFSANQGQDLKDLHKTASGGELSRLLLAFKNVMLGKELVQTVVFDEIDAGISGITAGKVAEKLVNISKFTQIVCITHTPVVASKANNFVLIEKNVVDGQTISTAKNLAGEEIVLEIARLIDGGKDVSTTAIKHAGQLIGKLS